MTKRDIYIVIYFVHGEPHVTECAGFKTAVETYRLYRKLHRDEVRLAKVVVNYGEEI